MNANGLKRLAVVVAAISILLIAIPTTASAGNLKQCGWTTGVWAIKAGKGTSCAFAKNVAYAIIRYSDAHGGMWGEGIKHGQRFKVRALDPATGHRRLMRCYALFTYPEVLRPIVSARGGGDYAALVRP